MNGFINLFKFEIKQNIKSLLIWFLSISLILILYSIMFPSFKSSDLMAVVNAKIGAFPKALTQAMGLDSYFNFQDIMYYSAYMFQFIVIAISVYSISLGSKIVAKEHEEKHIDYLASKPIKKETIILSKYSSFIVLVMGLALAVALINYVIICIFNTTNNSYAPELILMSVKLLFVYLVFGSLSFFATVLSPKTTKTNMIILGLFFGSYMIGVLSKMVSGIENLKYFSPYFMFETVKSYSGLSNENIVYICVLVAICLLSAIISAIWYRNKDLSI